MSRPLVEKAGDDPSYTNAGSKTAHGDYQRYATYAKIMIAVEPRGRAKESYADHTKDYTDCQAQPPEPAHDPFRR